PGGSRPERSGPDEEHHGFLMVVASGTLTDSPAADRIRSDDAGQHASRQPVFQAPPASAVASAAASAPPPRTTPAIPTSAIRDRMVMAPRVVLVQLDDELVARLDALAEREGTNRSELLRRGALAVLDGFAERKTTMRPSTRPAAAHRKNRRRCAAPADWRPEPLPSGSQERGAPGRPRPAPRWAFVVYIRSRTSPRSPWGST